MDPLIGEIKMFAGNFAPRGWLFCHGQLLPIAQNTALFSLLGTMYGGDGRTTFGLPDLRGRVPIGPGAGPGLSNYREGAQGGAEVIILNPNEIPSHTHTVDLSKVKGEIPFSVKDGKTNTPSSDMVFSKGVVKKGRDDVGNANIYSNTDPSTFKKISVSGNVTVSYEGGSQGHYNMQPFLAVNYIIATVGVFPARD